MNKRAFIIVLDSFGIGSSADASAEDQGANTLLHIAENYPLKIPNLCALGLNEALKESCGQYAKGLPVLENFSGSYGYAVEKSASKDTPSGHWEMAGLPVVEDWGYFKETSNTFPTDLLATFIREAKIPGVLGNCHASGTEILVELGEEHIKTGKPIVYASADSVFQIAVHEEHFGLERLYELCEIARTLVDPYRIARVIARPFIGETAQTFKRTGNRRDVGIPPFAPTLLDHVIESGHEVFAVGKVHDIFSGRGITKKLKGSTNAESFASLMQAQQEAKSGDFVFANFNDFDTLFGHRRNVVGYAEALEIFDRQLPQFIAAMQPGDLAIITADHGCDPTWLGTDHTREHVPVLAFGPNIVARSFGKRNSFADIGQTITKHLNVEFLRYGTSFDKIFDY
ncbi:MAG: phosphopentomutase [Pseudomonadota bacterium]